MTMLLSSAAATIWVVDPDGGGDATTLADGFALLSDGDTLEVRAGVCAEAGLSSQATDIRIVGAGAGQTILDGTTAAEDDYEGFGIEARPALMSCGDLTVQSCEFSENEAACLRPWQTTCGCTSVARMAGSGLWSTTRSSVGG
ncbi:MAG: hypothetical protein EXR69_00300 [Myxococcales bacterium]|nr:hypothetical protein [Myxococcales bacterium]